MADDDKKLPTNVIPFPSRDESGLRGLGQEVADSVNLEHLAKIFEQTSNTEEVTKALINVAVSGAILDQEFDLPPDINTFIFDHDSSNHIPSKAILRNLDEDYLALPYDIEQQFEDQMDEQYSTYDIYPDQGDMYSDKMNFGDWMENVLLREEDYKANLSNLENVLYKNYSKEFVNYLLRDPEGQQKFSNMITSIEDKYPRYNLFSPDPDDDIDVWRWTQGDPRPSLDKSETVPNITGRQKFFKQKREDDKEAYFQDIKTNVVPTELSRIYSDYKQTIPKEESTIPEKVGDVALTTLADSLTRLAGKGTSQSQPKPEDRKPSINTLTKALSLFKKSSPPGAFLYMMSPKEVGRGSDIVPENPLN